MKILLATYRVMHSGTGIPSYNQELIRQLGKKHEIWVLGETDEKEIPGTEGVWSTFGHSNGDYGYCSRLAARINEEGFDCIISSASSFVPVIAPFLQAPVVSVSHFVNGRVAKIAGYNQKYLNHIVSLSHYGKDFLVKKFRIADGSKVSVIYNSVKRLEPEMAPNERKEGCVRIVYPGGTSIEKSIDVVQRLLYRLLSSELEFEFYWLGMTTPMPADKYSILGRKETNGFFASDPRLKITGLLPREEAERIISDADIFLLPSRGEGCPMSLLEAMRSGCVPVVSDAHHGSRELIEQCGAGYIVPQGSDRALFETILTITGNPESWEECFVRTRGFVNDRLSPELWGEQMEKAIDESLKTEKKILPLDRSAFKKSYRGLRRIERSARIREIWRNARRRVRMDASYLLSKFGYYKN